MRHYGDITKLNGAELPVVDCITGGSPCQDLSVAGKRAGLEGERSGLFMEQIRIVKEMREHDRASGRSAFLVRPRYMVWENVPGALSSNQGKDFQAVLTEIVRIADPNAPDVPMPEKKWAWSGCLYDDMGRWSVAWRIHDAQFWGVPQRRKRIAVVADFGGLSAPEILFERKGLHRNPEPSEPERKETAGSTGTGSDEASGELLNPPVAGTLDSNYYKGPGERNGVERTNVVGFKPRNSSSARGVGCEVERSPTLSTTNNEAVMQVSGVDTYNQTMDCEVAQPLRAADGGDNTPKVLCNAYTLKVRGGKEIDSNGRKAGKGALIQTEMSGTIGVAQDQILFQKTPLASGVVSKGNGEAFLTEEKHMSLSVGGGQAGQGYPCVTVALEGNGTRDSHHGDGYSVTETMYTLNSTEQHAVAAQTTSGGITKTYRKQAHPMNTEMAQGYEETSVSDTLNIFDNTEARTPTLILNDKHEGDCT